VTFTCDKEDTSLFLERSEVPVPRWRMPIVKFVRRNDCRYVEKLPTNKPTDGNHGRGITVGVENYEDALVAFKETKEVSDV
jgi:cyanophycin synthetase